MAKNIKLRDLLNEDDVPIMKRVAGYKSSIDNYLTKTGPNKDGEYELDPRLAKSIEKTTARDATSVKKYTPPPPGSTSWEEMLANQIEEIADVIYDSKGEFIDDEEEALEAIKSIEDLDWKPGSTYDFLAAWEYLELVFANKYEKILDSYLSYFINNKPVADQFKQWINSRSWMPAADKKKYVDAVTPDNPDIEAGFFGLGGIGQTMARNAGWIALDTDPGKGVLDDIGIHAILDGLSFVADIVPLFGWAVSSGLDLLNAGIYTVEGEYYDAGMRVAFAAIPGVPGAAARLAKAGWSGGKTALAALGGKVALRNAGKRVLFTASEAAALGVIKELGGDISNHLMANAVKTLKTEQGAAKFISGWKKLSGPKKAVLVAAVKKTANSPQGRFIMNFIVNRAYVAGAEKVVRNITAVTPAEASKIFASAEEEVINYMRASFRPGVDFWEILGQNEFNQSFAPIRTFENKIDLKLRSILLSEQGEDTWENKQQEIQQDLDNLKKGRTPNTDDDEMSVNDLWYWTSLFLSYGGYALTGVSILATVLGTIGRSKKGYQGVSWLRAFDWNDWRNFLADKKGVSYTTKGAVTLTRKEYLNLTSDLTFTASRTIDAVKARVSRGELTPEQAFKMLQGVTPGTARAELEALLNSYYPKPGSAASNSWWGSRRSKASRTSSTSTSTSSTSGAASSNIGSTSMPAGSPAGASINSLTVNQQAAYNRNPNLTWQELRAKY